MRDSSPDASPRPMHRRVLAAVSVPLGLALLSVVPCLAVPACGGTDDVPGDAAASGGTAGLTTYSACAADKLLGEFVLSTDDALKSTGLEASAVSDLVNPIRVPTEVMNMGTCRVMQPARVSTLPDRTIQDVGTVKIDGLKVPVTLNKSTANVYTTPALPHPGFSEGADIRLRVGGAGAYGAFDLKGWGVAPLDVATEPLPVEKGKPVALTWPVPGKSGPAKMLINFSLDLHGSGERYLECLVPDTGSFMVEGSVVTELINKGTSGFPRVTFSRQSVDSTSVKGGCVQFVVKSGAERPLKIPGNIDCNDTLPCPFGKTCQDTLLCK